MTEFQPEDLGEVKRPRKTRFCPRCQMENLYESTTCFSCGIVFARAKAETTGVIRPVAPTIVPARSGNGGVIAVLLVVCTMAAVGWWWQSRARGILEAELEAERARPPAVREAPTGGGIALNGPEGGSSPMPYQPSVYSQGPAAAASAPLASDADEQSWRSRAQGLRSDLVSAQSDLARMEAALPPVVMIGTSAQAYRDYQTANQVREGSLAPYRARISEIQSRLAALPEECRRAGCAPGWIR